MKAILNGKLYDTEKSDLIWRVSLPTSDIREPFNDFDIYKTAKGNIFAEHKNGECLINENTLKSILQRPDCVDIYVKVFGEVEEA